jgi:chromosome segregation ATPase
VVSAQASLETSKQEIEAHEHGFEQQESEASNQVEGLGDDLQAMHDELDDHREDVATALGDLGGEAEEAATQTLTQAASDADAEETKFADRLSDWQQEIDREQGEVVSEGFGGLSQVVSAVEDGVGIVRDQTNEAFDDLDGGLQEFTSTAESEWTEAGNAASEATSDLLDQATSLETGVADAELAFDGLQAEAESAHQAVADGADTIYDQYAQAADAEATTLDDGWREATEDAAEVVGAAAQDNLVDLQSMVMDDTLRPLGAEYEALEAAMVEWEAVAAELQPLVADLVKCEAAVDQIAQLLSSLE